MIISAVHISDTDADTLFYTFFKKKTKKKTLHFLANFPDITTLKKVHNSAHIQNKQSCGYSFSK